MADPDLELRCGAGFFSLALSAFLPSAILFFFFLTKIRMVSPGPPGPSPRSAIVTTHNRTELSVFISYLPWKDNTLGLQVGLKALLNLI